MKLRIRLSKASWLLLTGGIVIIIFASLGTARFQQTREQNQLDEELSLTKQRLEKPQLEILFTQQSELEDQVTQIESEVATIKDYLSSSIENIEVIEALFAALAGTTNVEVVEINSSSSVKTEVEEITFSTLPFTVRIEGAVPNLLRFVNELSHEFPTHVVESIKMNIPEVAGVEEPTATIRLLIFTYEGD